MTSCHLEAFTQQYEIENFDMNRVRKGAQKTRGMNAGMNMVRTLKDVELLQATKTLVSREREITTEVIKHLAEIERRKLYCDIDRKGGEPGASGHGHLKYSSLFEYAVHELGYSEAAASRRISAMHLVRELPEVEAKIQSGALNLSNISKATTFFREINRIEPTRVVSRQEKAEILEKLEQKSAREGERILLALNPPAALPQERVRQVTTEHTELRFTIDAELKAKLSRVRSLMGARGGLMSLAELVSEMATLSAERLEEKKFGKRRVEAERRDNAATAQPKAAGRFTSDVGTHSRYISQTVKHAVWRAAHGKCAACGSTHKLQFDHIRPLALGGTSTTDNLQLLCGSCNLRRGVKTFGTTAMKRP